MSGVFIDIVIVLAVLLLGAAGYRAGLLKSVAALAGLLLGLALAVPAARLVGSLIESTAWRLGAVVGVLVLLTNCGYVAGTLLGERLRSRVRRPLTLRMDRASGGLLSVLIAVLLVWMLGLPLASSPIPSISKAVRGSVILPQIDSAMPEAARSLYSTIDSAIKAEGLPDVVGPLQSTEVAEVDAPASGAAADPEVVAASQSVVKVVGHAEQCDRVIDGSGFAYAPGRVATNAHVVAGTSSLSVETSDGSYDATVVYADENLDLAVLKVDGLDLPPLALAGADPAAETDLAVAGHPGGGALSVEPARARLTAAVTGPSFRGDDTVTRQVLILRAHVVPGNSGGPVLNLDGQVAGVIFGAAADRPEVGYALSITAVADELEAARSAADKVVTGACYP